MMSATAYSSAEMRLGSGTAAPRLTSKGSAARRSSRERVCSVGGRREGRAELAHSARPGRSSPCRSLCGYPELIVSCALATTPSLRRPRARFARSLPCGDGSRRRDGSRRADLRAGGVGSGDTEKRRTCAGRFVASSRAHRRSEPRDQYDDSSARISAVTLSIAGRSTTLWCVPGASTVRIGPERMRPHPS